MRNDCFFCGMPLRDLEPGKPRPSDGFALLIPPSQGGLRTPANMVPACGTCRGRKGDKNLEQYRQYVMRKTPLGAMHVALATLMNDERLSEQDRMYLKHTRDLVTPLEPLVFPGELWS